jgi:hypothetical protein
MALILKDRVKETTTVVGTGTVTLLGAADGYQSFAAIGNGNTTYYTITAQVGTEWEVGIGTYTSSGTTLSRDTVLASSSGGSLVSFSAGIKDVFVTQPSEKAVYTDATNIVNVYGNATNLVSFTDINASNVVMVSGTISTNAANATDIVNKQYVDGIVAAGVHYHAPVLVESPTALNATYNQPGGAGNGVGATLTNAGANVALVIDGVSVSNTARVLVYTQSNAVQNGIYTVTNPGAPDTPGPGAQWVLTRATDADTYVVSSSAGLSEGSTVFVQSGNTGAGETYTCNTQGTITFGSTNITFAQISTAQVYSAGTGLSLTNTTFNIANTTVVTGLYGDSANIAVIEVNPQGQLTSASNSAINVSNITVGTLSNDRTTASASNGANTIVLRDSNGSFNANVGTFTTVNATNGNFTNITANASGLTDINASNITSGTISNARTTANSSNSANTIVLRDANGSFAGNIVSGSFSGDGSAINAINASNISSGTIDNARTTAASNNGANTIVLRDLSGNFEANTVNAASFIGNGVQITAINASNLTTGTVDNARTTASSSNGASTIVLRDTNGSFSANVVNANDFVGNATSLTNINASNITSGTIGAAYVSGAYANVTGLGTVTSGTWQANVVASAYGGTGFSSYTTGDLIYSSATNTLSKLAIGANNTVLTSNGTSLSWAAPAGGSSVLQTQEYTATAGQTIFNVTYTVGSIEGVYRNGIKLGTSDYTATSGTDIVLASGAALGDLICIVSFFNVGSVIAGVNTLSFGSTGLTPSSATAGNIVVSGTLNVASGGTGLSNVASGRIPYGNGTNAISTSSTFVFDGTNLGVGASSPGGILDVRGLNDSGGVTLFARNTSDVGNTTPFIDFRFTQRSNNADSGRIRIGRDGVYSGTLSTMDSYMAFFTALDNADTERMRITSDGNVLVGKTSSITSSTRLDVATTDTTTTISSGGGAAISIQNLSTTNNTYSTIYFTNGGGGIDSAIYGQHEVGNGTGSGRTGSLVFATANLGGGVSERVRIDSTGNVLPGANGTQNLGSTGLRWANVYTSDLHLNNGIGNYTIVEGEEDLFLYNNKNGKTYKFALIEVDPNTAPPKMKE